MKRTVLTSSISLLMAGIPAAFTSMAPATVVAADDGEIRGIVTNNQDKQPINEALVILQCSCLSESLETQTNSRGVYRFANLPPGTYTIQVLKQEASSSKTTQLPRAAQFRADFSINPNSRFIEDVVVVLNSEALIRPQGEGPDDGTDKTKQSAAKRRVKTGTAKAFPAAFLLWFGVSSVASPCPGCVQEIGKPSILSHSDGETILDSFPSLDQAQFSSS